MKILKKEEMIKLSGGNSYLTSTFISAITRAGNSILEIGRSLGSAIRRIYEKNSCSL